MIKNNRPRGGRESKHKNSQDEKYSTLLSDVVLCFSLFVLLFELYVHVSCGMLAEEQVIRHPNWLCLESNCWFDRSFSTPSGQNKAVVLLSKMDS